jgi:beta-glucosidase
VIWGTRARARGAVAALGLGVALCLAFPAAGSAAGRCGAHPWCNTALSPDARASLLLGAMTRDEKIGLLGGDDLQGVAGAEGTHTGTDRGVPRVGMPPVYYSDGPVGPRSGRATAMPASMALASTFSRALAYAHGSLVGNEVRLKGSDIVFAPTVNIMRTPVGGRTFEGYGEDPYLVSRMGVGWIQGAQSQGVIADVKHFAANNQEGQGAAVPGAPVGAGVQGNRLTVDARVDERTLHEIYLPQFEAAVKEGRAGTVMCSYNRLNGQYACENKHLLADILRGEWGFKGYVLADYGAAKSTADSLKNGLDFDPFPGIAYSPPLIKAAVAGGGAPESSIDRHAHTLLRTLFAYGFFDRAAYANTPAAVDRRGHAARARAIEEAGTVLLKNSGVLPLDRRRIRTLAVIGPDATRFKSGGGSSNVQPYTVSTPLQGITAAAGPGVKVAYDDGSDAARTARVARGADATVVVAADTSSEGSDKPCLGLNCGNTDGLDRDALIARVAAANRRSIVVLETGGPVLTPWRGRVGALLESWYPGLEGGAAMGRVIFGAAEPGGRLPATFPRREADEPTAGDPEAYPGVAETVRYKEGVLVGYRWFDQRGIAPAFPFGHGLGYTTYSYRDLKVTPAAGGRPAATITARVTNTGGRAGTETAQLYLGMPDPAPGVNQPPRVLRGFARVAIRPGRTRTVRFTLGARDLSYWNTAARGWRVAPGCYQVMVGRSSRDIRLRGVISQGGARCACPSGTGFRSVSARPHGKRVRLSFERGTGARANVDVFRFARGRRAGRPRVVASFHRRTRSLTWRGHANRRGTRVTDGIYAVRFRSRGIDGRMDSRYVVLRRSRGRFARRAGFATPVACGLLAKARLASPAFGGRTRRPLRLVYRLSRRAKVSIAVLSGKRVVRRVKTRTHRAGRSIRVKLSSRRLGRGGYRVRIRVRDSRGRARATLAARRL